MKKGFTFIELLIVIAIIGIILAIVIPMYRSLAFQSRVSQAAILMDPLCKEVEQSAIKIKGQCFVLDGERHSLFREIHKHIKKEIRWDEKFDASLTVFVIPQPRKVLVGHYSVLNEPAYEVYLDICVFYFPENKPIGKFPLLIQFPPDKRPVGKKPEETFEPFVVSFWIESLMIEQKPTKEVLIPLRK